MSAIFISHSSKDGAIAADIKRRLEAQGHRSIFLDFDPEDGIPAGRDWEQELYHRIRASRAVIVLCSRHSMASRWCFMEITHARALGKHLFPVKIEDCDLDGVLTDRQVIDLTTDPEPAYERLWRGILAAGLDPADAFDWDGSRPPYPGLLAFQESDAAVFFGRDDEIGDGLDLLNKVHRLGETGLVMVLGASGTGKSSLVRAGLLPRLRRDVERWLVVDPFRPRDDPARELAAALSRAFERYGGARSQESVEQRLRRAMATPDAEPAASEMAFEEDPAARERFVESLRSLQTSLPAETSPRALRYLRLLEAELEQTTPAPAAESSTPANVFGELADELRLRSGRAEAKVLLVVDQFEELLGQPDDHVASRFLELLRAATERPDTSLLVLGTMRSDFLGLFQKSPALLDVRYESLSLGPMAPEDIVQIVEKPAELAAIDLESGLVRAMVDDAETEDALPLLAFTLRELYERFGEDGKLELHEYRERLGGLQGAVAQSADSLLESESLGPDEEQALKAAFLAMVRVTDEGGWSRRPAHWDDLPAAVHPLLEKFVRARLLISGSDGERRTLEVAHEALFRSWERLVRWLDQSAEALRLRHEIHRAAHAWDREGRAQEDLWRGGRLSRARELIASGDLPLEDLDLAFVEASEAAERARIEAEAARRRLVFRLVLTGGIVSLVLALIAVVFAWQAVKNRRQAERESLAAQEERREAEIAQEKALAAQNFAESQRIRVDMAGESASVRRALEALEPKYRTQSQEYRDRARELAKGLAEWRQAVGIVPPAPTSVFSLEVLRAESGLSLILHFGRPGESGLILVDGGNQRVYRENLRPRLAELQRRLGEKGPLVIDLVISTQVDDDHMTGLVELVRELEIKETPLAVRTLWSNVPVPEDETVRRAMAAQGKGQLVAAAQALGLPINRPFTRLVTLPDKGSARIVWGEDLSITVLGPSLAWLREFAKFFIRNMSRQLERSGAPPELLAKLAKVEIVEDFASDQIQLVPSPMEIEVPETPAAEDESAFNLASIVLMVESGGRRMFLPADARSDHLLTALAQAGYVDAESVLEVDVLALPHAGSHRNVSTDFFRRVRARHYVVPGNGRYTNPEVRTFEMLFEARKGDAEPFTLYLSYLPREYAANEPEYPADELCALFAKERAAGTPFEVVVPQEGKVSQAIDLLLATDLAKGTSAGVCSPSP